MAIICKEAVREIALLTASKTLLFQENKGSCSLIDEEYERAFRKGEASGRTLGYESALSELEGLFLILQKLISKLLEEKKRLFEKLKPEVVELSLSISECIIRKELSRPETLIKFIQTLLQECIEEGGCDFVRILLSPKDASLIKSYTKEDTLEGLLLSSDSSIVSGDCRIEMRSALLHHTVARELSELQAKILQR